MPMVEIGQKEIHDLLSELDDCGPGVRMIQVNRPYISKEAIHKHMVKTTILNWYDNLVRFYQDNPRELENEKIKKFIKEYIEDNYMLEKLKASILVWAGNRDLLHKENANYQFLKVTEEVGELAGAMARNDEEETKDALGDIFVTIVILADQLGLDLTNCVSEAYNQIKERTGETVNGVFIKDEE